MKKTVKYAITVCIGLVICLVVLLVKDIFHQTEIDQVFRFLSDGTGVAGILLACSGGLAYAANEGIFDGIKYSFGLLVSSIRVKRDEVGAKEDYYEYTKRKHEKKKSYRHLIIVGGCFIIVCVVFAVLYLNFSA